MVSSSTFWSDYIKENDELDDGKTERKETEKGDDVQKKRDRIESVSHRVNHILNQRTK